MESMPKKPSILFVDNDLDFGEYVVNFLKRKGYSVEFHHRTDEALRYIKSGRDYDIAIITDSLRSISAEEMARISKERHPNSRIMSFSVEDDRPEWADYNCNKCRIGYQGFDYLIGRINLCVKGY